MEKKECNVLKGILIALGAVAFVAGIAYAVYCYFIDDEFDEFDDEFYFDDEDIEDLLDEE